MCYVTRSFRTFGFCNNEKVPGRLNNYQLLKKESSSLGYLTTLYRLGEW